MAAFGSPGTHVPRSVFQNSCLAASGRFPGNARDTKPDPLRPEGVPKM
ncbi:Uncharacterised protein [Mycobacteroides abscessus subsp. abscessus]|nr:Uncharacterised protein [Mycobacteroides abscessus subsp. abscessus]